jgi:hypothetical protein
MTDTTLPLAFHARRESSRTRPCARVALILVLALLATIVLGVRAPPPDPDAAAPGIQGQRASWHYGTPLALNYRRAVPRGALRLGAAGCAVSDRGWRPSWAASRTDASGAVPRGTAQAPAV